MGEAAQRIGQPAGDGATRRRPVARPIGARPAVAARAAPVVSRRRRAEEHDRGRVPARHSDAAAADRHGNRFAAGQARRAQPPLRSPSPAWRSLRLRHRARRNAARLAAAQAGRAPRHRAVSRHRAVDLLGEDRRHGRARDEFHAPRHRPDHRRLRHSGGHDRLGHRRHRLRAGVGGHARRLVGRTRGFGNGAVSGREPDDRPAHRVSC